MDPNLPNSQSQPPTQPVPSVTQPVQPQAGISNANPVVQPQNYTVAQSEHSSKKAVLKVVLLLIVIIGAIVGLIYGGMVYMGQNKTSPLTQNANVFVEPTQTPITPTPTGDLPNPNDTSDKAIDQDTQIINNNLNNIDSSVNDVNQSLLDQQTNLQ